jgi:hypothetical protein
MDLKLSFKQLRPTGGDETAPYEVTTNRECTLKELIEKIKSGTSFGDMWIYEDYGCYFMSNYEKRPIEDFPLALSDKVVKRIIASGGWGRMDYEIWI